LVGQSHLPHLHPHPHPHLRPCLHPSMCPHLRLRRHAHTHTHTHAHPPPIHLPFSPQAFLQAPDDQKVTLEALVGEDVLAVLCCPLIQDASPGVQCSSLKSLASLCASEPVLAGAVLDSGALESLVISLQHDNAPVQAAADAVLQALARAGPGCAARIVGSGEGWWGRERNGVTSELCSCCNGAWHVNECHRMGESEGTKAVWTLKLR